jgi:hypothetical protein
MIRSFNASGCAPTPTPMFGPLTEGAGPAVEPGAFVYLQL